MDKNKCSYNISLASHCGTLGGPFKYVILLYATVQSSSHISLLFFVLVPGSCHLARIDCFQITYEIKELKLPFFLPTFSFIFHTQVLQNIVGNVHENRFVHVANLNWTCVDTKQQSLISIMSSGTVLLSI